MIVVDASAIVEVIAARPSETLAVRMAREPVLHAPQLLDVEVWSALRAAILRGDLTEAQASDAHATYSSLTIDRYPHPPLAGAVWELRHNLSTYDATYVALATALQAPVITTDARLARAPGLPAAVELYESDR